MTDQIKKPENPEGEIKKLLQAHMLVLKDKLGRVPTSDEIAEALKGNDASSANQSLEQAVSESPENSAEPKILKLKVYYGQGIKKTDKGEVKSPDPNKILFYEGNDGKTFDCGTQNWLDQRPPVLDHLPSRPLLFDAKNSDIVQAILHGVLDDEDFSELDKSGAINENTKKIFALQKKAAAIQQQLEKSSEVEVEDTEPETDDSDEENTEGGEFTPKERTEKVKTGIDVVKNYMDVAGVQYGMDIVKEEFGEKGVDLFQQILQAALADVDEKTRMLVREEMDECMAPVLDAIEALAAHIGLNIDLNEESNEGFGASTFVDNGHSNISEEDSLTGGDDFSNIEDVDEDSP